MAPNATPDLVEWAGVRGRASLSPRGAHDLILMNSKADVREALPLVQAPTLVLHRTGDRDANVEEGRYIAERIPGAKFVELTGRRPHPVREPRPDPRRGRGVPHRRQARAGVASACSQRCSSRTSSARRRGRASSAIARWAELLERHHDGDAGASSRASAARRSTPPATASSRSARGRRARSAARSSIVDAVGAARVSSVRAGVHTGEVERPQRRAAARHRRHTSARASRPQARRGRGARQLDDERPRRRVGHRASRTAASSS